jgi:hypothetical protein
VTPADVSVTAVERWIESPLKQFVDDAQALLALLLNANGQVLGQHGFTRAVDVMAACALAAAIHASSSELGRLMQGSPFGSLHHAGQGRQLFLSATGTARGPLVFLTVFDSASSLGIVQLYFEELRTRLADAAPAPRSSAPAVLAQDFESDLNRNLDLLFHR